MKKSQKTGSLLRVKEFSDSESDEEQNNHEDAEDQAMDSPQDEEMQEIPEESVSNSESKIKKKTGKKGIIYIGSIPQHMNVAICRELMEAFGEVGRIFLQPDKKGSKFTGRF